MRVQNPSNAEICSSASPDPKAASFLVSREAGAAVGERLPRSCPGDVMQAPKAGQRAEERPLKPSLRAGHSDVGH